MRINILILISYSDILFSSKLEAKELQLYTNCMIRLQIYRILKFRDEIKIISEEVLENIPLYMSYLNQFMLPYEEVYCEMLDDS